MATAVVQHANVVEPSVGGSEIGPGKNPAETPPLSSHQSTPHETEIHVLLVHIKVIRGSLRLREIVRHWFVWLVALSFVFFFSTVIGGGDSLHLHPLPAASSGC